MQEIKSISQLAVISSGSKAAATLQGADVVFAGSTTSTNCYNSGYAVEGRSVLPSIHWFSPQKSKVPMAETEVFKVASEVFTMATEVFTMATEVSTMTTEVFMTRTEVSAMTTEVPTMTTGVPTMATEVSMMATGVCTMATEVSIMETLTFSEKNSFIIQQVKISHN